MNDIKFNLPKDVTYIIDLLLENGYQGYIVGGCVRDMLLNIVPTDYDITTDALPAEIISIFQNKSSNLILSGMKHGTVGVCYKGEIYEITTFRIDGEYKDNRRPEEVKFTKVLYEDLSRRDFTVNAMAYNDSMGFFDVFKGLEDLNNKTIRTVGEPIKRFNEDALRLMRAVRFAAKYDFNIEENTLYAMGETGDSINKIAIERIQTEFNKILLYNPKYILLLDQLNILKNFPCSLINEEMFFLNIDDSVSSASMSRNDLKLRIAIIFQYVSDIHGLLKSMKYDNKTIKYVENIVNNIGVLDEIEKYDIRDDINIKIKIKEVLRYIGMNNMKDILYINKLNLQTLNRSTDITKKELEKKDKFYNKIEGILIIIIEREECFSFDRLNITGRELCSIGIKGVEVGRMLDYLLQEVIKDNKLNRKEILMEMIKLY